MNSAIWISIGRVSLVVFISLLSAFVLQLLLRAIERRLRNSVVNGDRLQRLTTLLFAGRSIGLLFILLMALLMILHELGINITPLLASAGVVGLAFSLGAQTFIKDFLGGIMILTEDQFKIGDVISVGAITGTVEKVNLRATYLRASDGQLYLIPNGDIRTVSNLSNQWAQVLITFNLDYEADMTAALQALEAAIQAVQADVELAPSLLEHPTALGWTGFTDWAVQAQLIAKAQPGAQWALARALRKAALKFLANAGVRLALPTQRIENLS